MKMIACACAFALATVSLLPTASSTYADDAPATAELSQNSTTIDIGRIRNVLQLTEEQQRYWPPVEAALRALARQQARAEPAGFVTRISRKAVSIVLDGAAIQRLATAARPLIVMLTQDQMRSASGLAQQMGLGPVVMAALR